MALGTCCSWSTTLACRRWRPGCIWRHAAKRCIPTTPATEGGFRSLRDCRGDREPRDRPGIAMRGPHYIALGREKGFNDDAERPATVWAPHCSGRRSLMRQIRSLGLHRWWRKCCGPRDLPPVAHPDVAGARIPEVPGHLAGACAQGGVACQHGTFVTGSLVARRVRKRQLSALAVKLLVRPIFAEAIFLILSRMLAWRRTDRRRRVALTLSAF